MDGFLFLRCGKDCLFSYFNKPGTVVQIENTVFVSNPVRAQQSTSKSPTAAEGLF
jgi:hypothetical protein